MLLVSLVGYSFDEPQRAIEFFNTVLENRTRLGEEASLCVEADIAVMNVRLGVTEEARVQLDAIEEKVQAQGTDEAVVFSKVYKAMAEYRKVIIGYIMFGVCDTCFIQVFSYSLICHIVCWSPVGFLQSVFDVFGLYSC